MPLAGFEPTIPASEQQQTHALDRAATGIYILTVKYLTERKINKNSSAKLVAEDSALME